MYLCSRPVLPDDVSRTAPLLTNNIALIVIYRYHLLLCSIRTIPHTHMSKTYNIHLSLSQHLPCHRGTLVHQKATPISLCLGQAPQAKHPPHQTKPSISSTTAFGTSRHTLLLQLLHVAAASQQLLSVIMMMYRSACFIDYRSYRRIRGASC